MDSNNWRAAQSDQPPPMDGGDWRSQLQHESRQRIVNKIMETLKRHLPFSGQEGLQELKKIAIRFEEKIYSAATSQSDYLRKISLKMLTMESKSQNTLSLPTNSGGGGGGGGVSRNSQDPVPAQNLQSQVHNQGQSVPLTMVPNQPQARQQLLAQNIQNNLASSGMQTSASLPNSLPSVSGLTQNPMSNVTQNQNLQNISSISQNSMGSTITQGVASNMFTNAQRQMQGRQHMQQIASQQQSQQSQNPQQYMYSQQLQNQMMKQKLQSGNLQQPLGQTPVQQQQQQPQQQQNLLQATQMQTSQQQMMQTSSVMQPPMISGLQQNQQSIQQQSQSVLQHQQSVLRQQQQQQQQQQQPSQQTSVIQQPQMQISQQPLMPSQQQQQQLMGQLPNSVNMQQNQMIGQQSNISDIQQQQQRLLGQQNGLSNLSAQQQNNHQNLQQHLMGQQGNISNMHQQLSHQTINGGLQQQQVQPGNSSMQTNQHSVHMMQQPKVAMQQQTQSAASLLPNSGQQTQPQSQSQSQQQLMSQLQTQSPQVQQHLGLQQQPNSLQHNMQQRIQNSNPLLQQQGMIDQQKQLFQSQRAPQEAPTTSLDSTAQTGGAIANAGDWQEEVYQRIKVLKDSYLPELSEMYQKISVRLQQNESLPQQPKAEQLEKLRMFKNMLERLITFIQVQKNNVTPGHRDKLASFEKQIMGLLHSQNRTRKPGPSMQQTQMLSQMASMPQPQQSQSQFSQGQSLDNGANLQLQPMNMQGSVASMHQSNVPNLQHSSVPTLSAISSAQQNIGNALQPSSNMDQGQGNAPSSMQQAAMASLQQNPASAQQGNMGSLQSQSGVNLLQQNVNNPQSNSNMLQNQHLKQQQDQMIQAQQLKQLQSRQLQQHILQKQLQQQQQPQFHQQTKQQQATQMQPQQMSQLNQMNDVNESKMRQGLGGLGVRSGGFPQHLSSAQRYAQQLKPGASFPISSPQLLQAVSPQINQHSSPQIDQQNMPPSVSKTGTPLHSANSPFVPSPSTPLAPSPMPGESEKPSVSSLSNTTNLGHQQINCPAAPQSLSIGTPGISASPFLEYTGADGTHGNSTTAVSGKSSVTERPLERLLKAVKSISPKALSASVSDIGSVVSMIDRIAGSAPGNGSRATVGEDLVAMTKCRLQTRNFLTQDGNVGTKRMRRYTSAMPLNVASSVGSMNDSLKQFPRVEMSELESTATSSIKKAKIEINHALMEEIREINERLIDTVVDISDEDVDPSVAAGSAIGSEGTIIKCCFIAVSLSPNLKSQYTSAQMSPIQPLRLLVPTNYPNCSPILLDKLPVEVSKEHEDLSMKAKSRFNICLRSLSQPMSLRDIARTWDNCARAVISEYAQHNGGGTFSSKYGTWENCLNAS